MSRSCRFCQSRRIRICLRMNTKASPKGTALQVQTMTDSADITSSGVLAASIEQSRRKWTVDGIFERYWAKPSKKRAQDIHNPATDTMSRLGVCSMVIEPHTFEVTLYTVREPRTTYQPPVTHPPFSAASPGRQQPTNPRPPAPTGPFYGQQPPAQSQPTLPTFREGFAHYDSQGPPPPIYHPFAPATPSPKPSGPQNTAPSSSSQPSGIQKPNPKSSPDPVIQMLATRAASDYGLKALMKVVASGKATQTELREFQNHIDDLNAEINAGRGPPPSRDRRPPNQPAFTGPSVSNHTPTQNVGQATGSTIASVPAPIRAPAPQAQTDTPIYSQYALPVKPKFTNPYKPDISAIVFDFGGKGDRFSFPRFSILEYLPGGTQVLVSFLVIRKGSEASSGNYKENMTYYQPVTLRLSTPQPRTLEPLARVVAPADDVRQYMNDVFDKMKPAETAYLAIRLPRTKDGDAADLDKVTTTTEKVIIKPFYSPPSFIAPMAA